MTDLADTGCKPQAHGRAMPAGQTPCPLCGRPRCTGTVRHSTGGGSQRGERCRRNPVPGGWGCLKHGSGHPQAREAGRRREADELVRRAARKALLDVDAEPVTDPVGAALRFAGQLQDMVETLGSRDSLSPEDRALFKSVVGHLGPLLLGLDKSDYKNRKLELEAEKLQLVRVALGRSLDAGRVELAEALAAAAVDEFASRGVEGVPAIVDRLVEQAWPQVRVALLRVFAAEVRARGPLEIEQGSE